MTSYPVYDYTHSDYLANGGVRSGIPTIGTAETAEQAAALASKALEQPVTMLFDESAWFVDPTSYA